YALLEPLCRPQQSIAILPERGKSGQRADLTSQLKRPPTPAEAPLGAFSSQALHPQKSFFWPTQSGSITPECR
ncbi:hypothetical protein P691DRAFT_809663, partial [Macrolepiota fuliginosa MF-IS2]